MTSPEGPPNYELSPLERRALEALSARVPLAFSEVNDAVRLPGDSFIAMMQDLVRARLVTEEPPGYALLSIAGEEALRRVSAR